MRLLRFLPLAACGVLLAPAARAGGKKTSAQATHVVQAGDTLWDIAQASGCGVQDVRRANALKADNPLRIGDHIRLPTCGGVEPSAKEHTVAAGETLSAIALRYDTSVASLQALNGLRDTMIRPGQELTVGSVGASLGLRVVSGQSVGRPQRGTLVDGVRLPHDPGYYRRRVARAYGAQHVVDYTRRAVASVRDKHPGLHRLAIGDLSAEKGGALPGHSSHQSGRDIDIGLYFQTTPSSYPQEFVNAHEGKLHRAATWALVHAFYEVSGKPGGPEKIFLDYKVQGKLYEHARKQGVSKKVLGKIFQYPNGHWAKDRLVSHEPLHADHLHVRFACPASDTQCK